MSEPTEGHLYGGPFDGNEWAGSPLIEGQVHLMPHFGPAFGPTDILAEDFLPPCTWHAYVARPHRGVLVLTHDGEVQS